jgi:hypothetical protein
MKVTPLSVFDEGYSFERYLMKVIPLSVLDEGFPLSGT